MKRKGFLRFLCLALLLSVCSASPAAMQDGAPNYVIYNKTNQPAEYLYRTMIQIPVGVVWGPDGYIYVADWTGRHIVKIDKDFNMTDLKVWETVPAFRQDGPRGLAFDSQGNLYVNNHSSIFKMDVEGNIEQLQNIRAGTVGSVAVSPSDELYYTDREKGLLLKWTPDNGSRLILRGVPNAENLVFGLDGTLYLTQMGSPDLLKVDVETGNKEIFLKDVCGFDQCFLSIDREGDIWIRAIFTLYQYSPDGEKKPYTIYASSSDNYRWHTSAGIAIDDDGGVWVACHNSRIYRLAPKNPGEETVDYEVADVHIGMEASDLAVDSNDMVYATELNSYQVLKIDPEGKAETLVQFTGGGRRAVAVDKSNNVYYSTDKSEIRRVDQDGNDTHYAYVQTERMVFGADGVLYAVTEQTGEKVIVGIPEIDSLFTLVSEINGKKLGGSAMHVSPAQDTGLYLFSEGTRNLYFVDFSGNGRLVGNFSQLGGGVFCMAANPVIGEIYLILHGNCYLYSIDPNDASTKRISRIFGDPWGMVVSDDGTSLYVAASGSIHKIPLD